MYAKVTDHKQRIDHEPHETSLTCDGAHVKEKLFALFLNMALSLLRSQWEKLRGTVLLSGVWSNLHSNSTVASKQMKDEQLKFRGARATAKCQVANPLYPNHQLLDTPN